MILKLARSTYLPLWRTIQNWIDADGLRMSAAMSFYGILSVAPLLVLMVALLGRWLDRAYIETSLVNQISRLIGAQVAEVVKQAIASARAPSKGLTASLIPFLLLVSLVVSTALGLCLLGRAAIGRLKKSPSVSTR